MSQFSLDAQLKWLDMGAPRYTSYPSALYFEALTPDVHQGWLQTFDLKQSIALYIHVPFCHQLCWFCGCHTKISNHYSSIAAYTQSLVKEIELIGQTVLGKMTLHSIHFGGGSPAILNDEDMDSIFASICSVFNIQSDAEIAIEFNPGQMTYEKIKTYKRLGFNRVSLGVQDTNAVVQKAINREHSFEQIQQCVDWLKTEDIHDINLDLIYGLPFQTMQSIEETINQICSLEPSRVAYYSFAHVPWMKKHQKLIDEGDLPNAQTKGRMYLHALNIFEKNGYKPFGIDHFSKPNDECFKGVQNRTLRRNFMGYTIAPNDFVLGVGASAISHLGKGISQNSVLETEYKANIEQGIGATKRGWIFTREDYLRKTIINELMCYFNVDLERVLGDFGFPPEYFDNQKQILKQLIESGVISLNHRHLKFHSPLRMIVRLVCSYFDEYHLKTDKGRCLKIS